MRRDIAQKVLELQKFEKDFTEFSVKTWLTKTTNKQSQQANTKTSTVVFIFLFRS
jgi:hypothetical protein